MQKHFPVTILGGGILGTTLAYWLSIIYEPGQICVLEKENDVAQHMSGRNTGVIHRPFYLDPKKKKTIARAANLSYEIWKQYAAYHNLPWHPCGTIQVAMSDDQITTLNKYRTWAKANGMRDDEMEILNVKQITALEPAVKAPAAFYCKTDVSVDFEVFTKNIRKESEQNGAYFETNFEVIQITPTNNGFTLTDAHGKSITTNLLINCAGGNALKFAHMLGVGMEYADLNFRGEYWKVDPTMQHTIRHNIYSVPRNTRFPFLDPHWVIRIDKTAVIGPNAVPVIGPYTYKGWTKRLSDIPKKLLRQPNNNIFKLLKNREFLQMSWHEWKSALSNKQMVSRIQKFIPEIGNHHLIEREKPGVRASLIDMHGNFVPEVLELERQHMLHILNYNSPGATGAPVYTHDIVQKLKRNRTLDHLKKRDRKIKSSLAFQD